VEVLGVHHAALSVADLRRSLAFYERLGFALERRVATTGADAEQLTGIPGAHLEIALLTLGAFRLELVEYARRVSDEPPPNNHVGVGHVCLHVRDLARAQAELEAEGVAFQSPPVRHPSGATIVYFRDPDGITVELLEVREPTRADYR
jgi:catechol 2,3-dioxygenase-like lactoylglutathione lyase family enzyme